MIDASIYAQANNPAVKLLNPNDIMQQQLQIQQAQNANRLFQATNAAGQVAQQSINPLTGKTDPVAFGAGLAGLDPSMAMAVPGALQANATLQGQNVSNQSAQQGIALKNLQAQSAALGSLQSMNGGDGPTFAQVQSQVQMGLDQGWLQPHGAGSVLLGMPTGDDAQSMATRKHMIQTMDQQSVTALDRLQTAGGSPSSVTNGPQLQPGMTGGMLSPTPGGFSPAGAPITVGLPTAAGRLGIVSGPVGPGGAPTTQTLGQNLTTRGLDQNGDPLPNPAFANLPSSLRNPNAPPPTGATITTGMGPAATSAASTAGSNSANAFASYADDGVKAQTQNAILGNMLSDTGQFTTGPGAAGIKQFQSVMQRLSPSLAKSFNIDPGSVAANESFNKFAAQLANAQGAGSDARLSVNIDANPHADMSPAGADLIIRQLQGNADYTQARAKLASTYPNQADRAGFESQTGSNLDPRVFQYNRLTPQQKTTYFNNLSDKTAFMQSYQYANMRKLVGNGQ